MTSRLSVYKSESPASAAIEAAEMRAWKDLYAAAPPAFARAADMETTEIGGALAIRWAATGRRYFSRVIGLGATQPATEDALDALLAWYEQHGVAMFLLQ